jgi:sphingosine kinase
MDQNNLHQHDSNPFEDSAGSDFSSPDSAAVLTVDRNATLTLGTDALILLDEGLRHKRAASNFCGLLPQLAKTTRAIPFHHVLWAEFDDVEVAIQYTQTTGRNAGSCRVQRISYAVTDKSLHTFAKRWVQQLLDRAYPVNVMRKKRIKVLVNPFGGQGQAQKLWTSQIEPVLAAAMCHVDVECTKYRGHAIEIAENLDIEAYDVVACASGDGLPHEVFNGLAKHASPKRALRKIAVFQLPCGSGNAMSLNTTGTASPSLAALELVKAIRTPLDLIAVSQGSNVFYSFLSQAVGIVAESDLGTESLRWMGSFRFTWGFLVRLLGKTIYPAEVSLLVDTKDKDEIRSTYRAAAERIEADRSQAKLSDAWAETLPTHEDAQLPALKYGTVHDDLPAGFSTQDMPNLGNFYVGNMCLMSADLPFFSTSLPSDGRMDLLTIAGDISRITALRMLTSVEEGTLINFPEVSYQKVLAYRIKPRSAPVENNRRFRRQIARWLGGAGRQTAGLISIDGESVPFEPFQAEIVPQLGTILSKYGAYYGFDHRKLK